MDPVTSTSAARDVQDVARAARLRTADPAAAAGGVAAKGTAFTEVLQAATEGTATRGPGRQAITAEAHSAVDGHRYAKITAGLREGSYLNTSGNARHGEAFALVERGGRTFHVYGDGADRRVVEVKARAKDTAAAPTTEATTAPATAPAAATPAATTTPAATAPPVDATAAAGGVAAPDDDA